MGGGEQRRDEQARKSRAAAHVIAKTGILNGITPTLARPHHGGGKAPPIRERRSRLWEPRVRVVAASLLCLVFASLLQLGAALPAHADEFATLVSALAADSFAEKERAVVALGKLGNERAVAMLRALSDGRLLRTPNARVLISDPKKLTDPLTGANLPAVAAEVLDRIRVNSRLRGAIEVALGELTLFSSDPATRLSAAQDAVRHPSTDQAALLEKAIAREQDPAVPRGLFALRGRTAEAEV